MGCSLMLGFSMWDLQGIGNYHCSHHRCQCCYDDE